MVTMSSGILKLYSTYGSKFMCVLEHLRGFLKLYVKPVMACLYVVDQLIFGCCKMGPFTQHSQSSFFVIVCFEFLLLRFGLQSLRELRNPNLQH